MPQVKTKKPNCNQHTLAALTMNYLIKPKHGGPQRESC